MSKLLYGLALALATAAMLWIFTTLLEHDRALVRLEVQRTDDANSLAEVKSDVKYLVAAEQNRMGREDRRAAGKD